MLVEPPHHVAPPSLEELFFNLTAANYVPILTHPERLTWINSASQSMERLHKAGVWFQVTAGSLAGDFGRNARYWAERILDEGKVHLLATDAHDLKRVLPGSAAGETGRQTRWGYGSPEFGGTRDHWGCFSNVRQRSCRSRAFDRAWFSPSRRRWKHATRVEVQMRETLITLAAGVLLAGCVSFSSSSQSATLEAQQLAGTAVRSR